MLHDIQRMKETTHIQSIDTLIYLDIHNDVLAIALIFTTS